MTLRNIGDPPRDRRVLALSSQMRKGRSNVRVHTRRPGSRDVLLILVAAVALGACVADDSRSEGDGEY
jgi:hypothetical protein